MELYWDQWPEGICELTLWSLITETQKNVGKSFGAATGTPQWHTKTERRLNVNT